MPRAPETTAPPPIGTLERWAYDLITATTMEAKLSPSPLPDPRVAESWENDPPSRVINSPGRPPELSVVSRSAKRPRNLHDPEKRAELFHRFLHHELQAAELMAWAFLRFVDTPKKFRRGLLGIAQDELRHMRAYETYINDIGYAFGSFPVRDWFWQRVPSCDTPSSFVATLGVGFEGGNLDHADRFAAVLTKAGETQGAELLRQVGDEERAHVRFAWNWLKHWQGEDFDAWRALLPPPLSPTVMRGRRLNHPARRSSGQSEEFVKKLEAWERR